MKDVFRALFALLIPALALGSCGEQGARRGGDPFGPAVVRLGDAVAATVDGTTIYVSDVRREAAAQGLVDAAEPLDPASPRFAQALDDLIHRRILALEAKRRQLDESDEARRRIAAAQEVILYNILIETVLDEVITEDALRRLYEEQSKLLRLGDEVRARHIVVATVEEAEALVGEINAGANMAELALERSLDPDTRLEGGDLGFFTREEMIAPIVRAAFATTVGQVARPFRTELGWHVLRVEDRRAEQPPTFEEMRPDLVRFLTYQELERLSDVLESRADVVRKIESLAPAGLRAPAPLDPDSNELDRIRDELRSTEEGAPEEPSE